VNIEEKQYEYKAKDIYKPNLHEVNRTYLVQKPQLPIAQVQQGEF
jgi:hypothetical protein